LSELLNIISDPENPEYNFALGLWYEDQGHTSAAASFYVNTAEYSRDNLLAYEALLRLANCFTRQGSRNYLTKGILLRAISLIPDRPEAYFLLSRLYEVNKDWQESYTFSILGQKLNDDHPPLRTNVDYPGRYALVFEQAVSGWWIGLFEESIHLFKQLKKNPTMLPIHIAAVQNNLRNLEGTLWVDPLTYYDSMYEHLRMKFPGSRSIEQNYSQCYQDMFVLTMLNGKRDGLFFEVGSGDPTFGSNTKLLEEWGWKGTSIDIDPEVTAKFYKERKSFIITADATKLDYSKLVDRDYDYLQIDIDPALNSLEVLLRMPFEKYRFAVITFEHDDYCSPGIKERSRKYIKSHDYVLVVGDIAPDRYNSFEDWWVHPELVNSEIIHKMQCLKQETRRADLYMLL
jgi:tetratricopeptide (TPR) repeat protein